MKEFKYVITDPVGIHARPAGIIVNIAKAYVCKITIAKAGKAPADAKRIFGIMALGVKSGEEVTVCFDGDDEEQASADMEAAFKANL